MVARNPRVLVIDDDVQIHRFLAPALHAAGFEAERAETGKDGLRSIAGRPPDAVLLDLGLPDMDGKKALKQARAFFDGPVIILSARGAEIEKIETLDLGADDYVQKPFGVGELLARLRVALRRRAEKPVSASKISAGDLELDLTLRLVTVRGKLVHLSPKEYELLVKLAEAGGRVLTHRQLLAAVWGQAHENDMQYLRVFIGQLRQKLERDPASPRVIWTESGIGYRFWHGPA